jgi:hypothetical protein
LPLALHVCTPLPEHRVVFGAQTPLQPPDVQAWLPQSIGAPQRPVVSHTWTALPEHSVVPEEHGPPPSDETSSWATSSGAASASRLAPTASVTVASATSETVESAGPVFVDGAPLLLLLLLLLSAPGPASSVASGSPAPPPLLPPPQEATTFPASTPTTKSRIQGLESIMRPLELVWLIPMGSGRAALDHSIDNLYDRAARDHEVVVQPGCGWLAHRFC